MIYKGSVQNWSGVEVDSFISNKPTLKEAVKAVRDCFGLPLVSVNKVNRAGLKAYCFETPYRLSTLFVVYAESEV